MIDFIGSVLALVVALGVLIAVHEFGHFWVARRMGVKVLRFSIGFGRPLWSRKGADGTEYVVAAIPLGGYVKMLDEREVEVPEEELDRAFNRKSVARRFAIVAAGPFFNFLFAVFAFWLMFVNGIPGIKPIVGEVVEETPAARADLRPGQQIVAVGGEETPTWDAVFDRLLPKLLLGEPVELTILTDGRTETRQLPLKRAGRDVKPEELVSTIGLRPQRPDLQPVIGEIQAGSPAENAGLQPDDEVVAIAGQPVHDWQSMVEVIRENPGEALTFSLLRNGERIEIEITPARVETEQGAVGRIGAQVKVDPSQVAALTSTWQQGPVEAVGASIGRTWEMSTLTLRMLGEMVIGRVSTESISGPITIARYAKDSAYAGFSRFLSFLAIVSISLGVLNLLPIPVLDGGHLMFYLVEAVKGSPVSETTEAVGQRIGIAIIIALMTLAFYNDLVRLTG
ncbi:RIP metalloprotease RseP [Thiohalomonas denitrificans]|uniref:Zinc metalloprotease n=1 Tax=Thiohalomonas denitrificans TaxID=415747 RepID=A0A1G5Q202_9GAMM|nr:RIP metalloprotease RseP [Thiohalomonas denitrificans]SCZ55833.1 regulator of sigma E protease [Thiohalomonas denitrificans]